jgi:hypothetical protein
MRSAETGAAPKGETEMAANAMRDLVPPLAKGGGPVAVPLTEFKIAETAATARIGLVRAAHCKRQEQDPGRIT